MKNNYLNLLGLAQRARKCALGEEAIVKSIQQNKAKLVLIAEDIGSHTRKKIVDKCTTFKVPFVVVDNRDVLSQAIGQSQRVAVAILDAGFAKKMASILKV